MAPVADHRAWAMPGGSHDRLIAILRVALPIAVVALVILLALAPLTSGRDISFLLSKNQVDVAHERMRVTRATYRGRDDKDQPFSLVARSAVQATSKDPVVKLDTLSANVLLNDGTATITAPRGRYDMDKQTVAIDGPVLVRRADGSRLATRDVAVDLNAKRVASGGPVDGSLPLGRFSADHMTADLNTRVVVLAGRARLHIVQARSRARP